MTKRQLKGHVTYLRALYAELDALSAAALTPIARERYAIAANHGKALVAAMIDAWNDANQTPVMTTNIKRRPLPQWDVEYGVTGAGLGNPHVTRVEAPNHHAAKRIIALTQSVSYMGKARKVV